jgi:hypothetical protein
MPTIEFKTYNDTAFELMRPVPASKMQPDWWKKSKVHMIDKGVVGISLRACPAMHDWLSTGYYIATNRDIHCEFNQTLVSGGDWHATVPPDGENFEASYASPTHSKHQLMNDNFSFLKGDGSDENPHDAFKFRVPWSVVTPPGYSCLYLDPFLHQNKYFRTWQGTMDTDMFNTLTDNTQIIMYPLSDKSFVIPKGTPIVQIVPYRREQWTASYINMDGSAYINEVSHLTSEYGKPSISELCEVEGDASSPDGQVPGGFYRKYMWTTKAKNFKDAPPNECPFDPKTGEMKK